MRSPDISERTVVPEGHHPLPDFVHLGVHEAYSGRVDAPAPGDGLTLFLPERGQPLDAAILTPFGWTTLALIQPGNRVLDVDGHVVEVVEVSEVSEKEVWRVHLSDDASVECVANQIWRLRRGTGLRAEMCHFTLERLRAAQSPYYVAPIQAFDGLDLDLPLPPYLLGALIGDGGFSNKQVNFATADAEMIELLRPLLPAEVSLVRRALYWWALATRCCGRPNPVIGALRALGLMGKRAEKKSIPSIYKRSSLKQRVELLQGLMDTDGCESSGKPPMFWTVSDQLAADVRELVRSMGGTARMRTSKGTVLPLHRLSLSLPSGIAPFRLSRKARRYDGQGYSLLDRRIARIERVGVRSVRAIVIDSATGTYISNDHIGMSDGLSLSSAHVKRIKAVVHRSATTPIA